MSGRLVLVRHGQSYGNVDRRLDTRPPGTELTPLGRAQARSFAQTADHAAGLLAHSSATRARQTALEIGGALQISAQELDGLHEVQVGDLENRNDDEAIDEFTRIYHHWHSGELDIAMPGGESGTDVLDRCLPVLTELRRRYLDDDAWAGDIVVVSHGAAIRLAAKALSGVDGEFALTHHLANLDSVVLAPITDGRWSCVHWGSAAPPFYADDTTAAESEESSTDPMG
jgi:broad specificity phosphatase PhoE